MDSVPLKLSKNGQFSESDHAMMGKKVEDVRIVPGGVEDITVGWCDEVLHQGGCIQPGVAVARVQAERLTGDSSEEDGGGLSEALLIKIQVEYRY